MIDHYDRSLLGRTCTRNDGELAVKVQKSHFADDEIVNGDATSIPLWSRRTSLLNARPNKVSSKSDDKHAVNGLMFMAHL
jgi:hypothetical protein